MRALARLIGFGRGARDGARALVAVLVLGLGAGCEGIQFNAKWNSGIESDIVSAVDGDTLVFWPLMRVVDLRGINAPARNQMCERDGEPWDCAKEAHYKLGDLIRDETVRCESRKVGAEAAAEMVGTLSAVASGPTGWLLSEFGSFETATCKAGGRDLAKEMVEAGLAAAEGEGAYLYLSAQRDAQRKGLGIWAARLLER